MSRILLRTVFEADSHMDDSVNGSIDFLVRLLPETAMGLLCNCLVGALPYTRYVTRSPPLCGVKVLPAQKCEDMAEVRVRVRDAGVSGSWEAVLRFF